MSTELYMHIYIKFKSFVHAVSKADIASCMHVPSHHLVQTGTVHNNTDIHCLQHVPKLILELQDWTPIKKKEKGQSREDLSLPLPDSGEISAPVPALEAPPEAPPHSQVLTEEMITGWVEEALNRIANDSKDPVSQPPTQPLMDDPIPLDPAKLPTTSEPTKDCFLPLRVPKYLYTGISKDLY